MAIENALCNHHSNDVPFIVFLENIFTISHFYQRLFHSHHLPIPCPLNCNTSASHLIFVLFAVLCSLQNEFFWSVDCCWIKCAKWICLSSHKFVSSSFFFFFFCFVLFYFISLLLYYDFHHPWHYYNIGTGMFCQYAHVKQCEISAVIIFFFYIFMISDLFSSIFFFFTRITPLQLRDLCITTLCEKRNEQKKKKITIFHFTKLNDFILTFIRFISICTIQYSASTYICVCVWSLSQYKLHSDILFHITLQQVIKNKNVRWKTFEFCEWENENENVKRYNSMWMWEWKGKISKMNC